MKFLQHGSIPLAHDEDLLKAVSPLKEGPAEIRMTSLSEVLGRKVDFGWAVERLVGGFEEFFGVRFGPLKFMSADREKILEIQRQKYGNDDWTLRGQVKE